MNPRRSAVLDAGLMPLVRVILVFSLFLLFAGHNAPGGGFVGGLVGSAAFVLVFVARGGEAMRRTARFDPAAYLGAGLVIAGATGAAALIAGNPFLTTGILELEFPLLGKVKATSALPFDVGVYLVVAGLVLAVLGAFDRSEEGP